MKKKDLKRLLVGFVFFPDESIRKQLEKEGMLHRGIELRKVVMEFAENEAKKYVVGEKDGILQR